MSSFPAGIFAPAIAATGSMPRSRIHGLKNSRGLYQSQPSTNTATAATRTARDRKSTRLNSSHEWISYAVFCLKKKKDATLKPRGEPTSVQMEGDVGLCVGPSGQQRG